MLQINFAIIDPWSNRYSLISKRNYSLTKNKNVEFGLYRGNDLLGFNFNITGFRVDHDRPGFFLCIGLIKYEFEICFYDNRDSIDNE